MNHELQNFGDMNATLPIYSLSGAVVATAIVTEPAISHEELMTADYVKLSWNSDTGDTLPAGAYITIGGERYSLLEPYTPTRANEAEYQYTPQFQSRIMAWQKHIVPIYTYEDDGATVKTREMDWDFTGSPADAMYMVQQAIRNETGEQWTVQLADSLPATIAVSSQSGSIFSLLSDIAGQCETEWWADKATNTLYLSRCQRGTAIALTVGDNVGVPSVTASQDGYYTRFYVFGSTRNVTQDSGAAATNSVINKRLTLDPATYPGGYIDARPNLQEGDIFTRTLYYDDIYPSSKLTISDVRARLKYRLDSSGNKIQTGEDSEGNPIYEQYAIWYFKIAGFDFDPTTIIPQTNLSVHFEDGQLAGRDFELTYHDKADNTHYTDDALPFVVEAGDYEITIDESGGTIIPGLAYIIPQDGDKVILYNIVMPAEYTASAQQELAERAQKDIAKMTADNNSYEMDSYPTEFEADDTDLTLGQAVTYTNGDTVLSTRVLMVEKHLDANCQQRIRVGNALIKGNTQQLREEMTQATQNIDILAAFNNLSASLSNAYAKVQREMLEGFARIGNMWKFDPDDPTVIYSDFSAYVNGFLSAKGKNPEAGSEVSGSTTLAGLTDVSITGTPGDGQVLAWSATLNKWTPMDMEATAGIDEEELLQILTQKGYATQTWVTQQSYAKTSVRIKAGTGLTGGGTLAQDVTLSLAAVGTAGTYTKVTVDSYGRVTGHASLTQGDIPALAISKITGLQTALDAKLDVTAFEELFEKVWVSGYGYAIRAKLAFYSDDWISAKGLNSDAGSTTGGVDEAAVTDIVNDILNDGKYATQSWVNSQGFLTQGTADGRYAYKDGSNASGTWGIGITGNAGTATKLQTARTLWGQPFDGSANVDGNITVNYGYVFLNHGWFQNNQSGFGLYNQELDARWYATTNGWTSDKLIIGTVGFQTGGYVQIGNAVLRYDASNNALYVQNADGSQCGFYATGFMSAKGLNSDAGSTTGGVDENEVLQIVEDAGYIKSSALSGYATQSWVRGLGYATQTWVNSQGYLTQATADGRYYYGHNEVDTSFNNATAGGGYYVVSNRWPSDGPDSSYRYGALAVFNTDGGGNQLAQLYISHHSTGGVYTRMFYNSWSEWRRLLDDYCINDYALTPSNYTDYTVTKTGGGASGTWGIGITGNAGTATRLATARTIWGKSFDGTGNVDGNITVNYGYVFLNHGWFQNNQSGFGLYNQELDARWYATTNGWTSDKLIIGTVGFQTGGYVQIGNAVLRYDASNNALYVQNADGSQCGFYATGFMSAKGLNSDGGSAVAGATTLNGLTDVTISSPSNGQSLVYRNGVWRNETVSGGGGASVNWDDIQGKPTWIPDTDGSGSGIDADLLDGTHKSKLFTALSYSGSTLSITIGGTRKTATINASGGGASSVSVSSSSSRNISVTVDGHTDYVNDVYATYSTYADQLRTARTIWGQNFNGGSSISGALTGVTTITASGNIKGLAFYLTEGGGLYYVGGTTYLDAKVGNNFAIGTSNMGTIPTLTVRATNANFSGKVNQSSDIRLKEILDMPVLLSVDDVARAPIFHFRWKDGRPVIEVGTSAQYWQRVLPQVVSEGDDGMLSMQYGVAALAAVITTARTVVDHEARIKALEKENMELKNRLKIMERRVA